MGDFFGFGQLLIARERRGVTTVTRSTDPRTLAGRAEDAMNWHLIFAVALAAVLPIALIITGVELRRVRLRFVQELEEDLFKGKDLPQLVLARKRYDT